MGQQLRGPGRGDDAKQDGLCYAQNGGVVQAHIRQTSAHPGGQHGSPNMYPNITPPPPASPTCSSPASTRASLSMSLAPGAPSPNTTASAPLIPASSSTW